jgi:UDP-N-acetylmuramoyl-tripeptide--D-alanyl-D-alanine ligase
MPENLDYVVLELGMNHAGEISDLVRMAHPHISGITWIGESHIENLGSRENIAKAKAEIFEWQVQDGTALIPADNDFYELLHNIAEENSINNIYSFGKDVNQVTKKTGGFEVIIDNESAFISEKILNNQILNNLLLTLTIAKICGIDLNSAISSIEKMERVSGRGKKIKLKNEAFLIDDSYNASPTSMKLALDNLACEKGNKIIAALGDMKELGEFSKNYHEELVNHLSNLNILVCCGKDMKYLFDKVISKKTTSAELKNLEVFYFSDIESCFKYLSSVLQKNDILLVKGSHSSNMWKIVDMF